MSDVCFTEDAQQSLEKFLSAYPAISRNYHRERIEKSIEYFMLKEGQPQATKDILIRAIQDRFPSSEPSVAALKDPAGMMETVRSMQAIDEQDPVVKITRWEPSAAAIDRPVRDVFAFMASPRRGGNTDCITDALLDGVRSADCTVEKLSFADLSIAPCSGCLACQKEKLDTLCAIKDDMTHVYKRLIECDAFVFAFPIYTGRESSHAAVFFDRLKALTDPWAKTKYEPRKAALVATWGWPSEHIYDSVVHNMAAVFRIFGVEVTEVVTGGGFWDAYYRKGTALLDDKGIAAAREAGRSLAGA